MRVAVLKGGRSLEREVSLRSAAQRRGRPAPARPRRSSRSTSATTWSSASRASSPTSPSSRCTATAARTARCRSCSEILGIPYTGARVPRPARVAWTRSQAKQLIREAGIPTPDCFAFSQTAFRELGAADGPRSIGERLGFPLVVKPGRGGSALGVTVRHRRRRGPAALVAAFSLRRPGAARALRRGPRAGGLGARRRGAAGGRGDPRRAATSTTSRPATRSAAPRFVCPAELSDEDAAGRDRASRSPLCGLLGVQRLRRAST